MSIASNPDREVLAQLGDQIRTRLAADPSVYRVPVEKAEIYAISDFISPDECSHLMKMIDRVAKPSALFDDVYIESYRTSFSGDVDTSDSFVKMIERRFSDLLGIDMAWGETIQGQRYLPGQEFREHCDWFDTNAAYWAGEAERGGQRSWTAMAYLNDVEKGGETEFPNLQIRIRPQSGVLLLWNNATLEGKPNIDTIHAALPVETGVKYVITKWFRTRVWC